MNENNHIRGRAYLGIAVYLVLSYAAFVVVDAEHFRWLEREDGYFESVGAFSFFLASVVFLLTFLRSSLSTRFFFIRTRRSLALLFLSLLFLFGAGEETRWGQVFFDFKTPAFIAEKNTKGEFSLHNIPWFDGRHANTERKTGLAAWLTIEKMFSIFWFGYCFCLPLFLVVRPSLKDSLHQIGIPLVPVGLGAFFLANYVFAKISRFLPTAVEINEFIEVKEANFAFLFLVLSLYFYRFYVPTNVHRA